MATTKVIITVEPDEHRLLVKSVESYIKDLDAIVQGLERHPSDVRRAARVEQDQVKALKARL